MPVWLWSRNSHPPQALLAWCSKVYFQAQDSQRESLRSPVLEEGPDDRRSPLQAIRDRKDSVFPASLHDMIFRLF